MDKKAIKKQFTYWINILRLKNNWDVKLEFVTDKRFKKTGDFKVDTDDKKAVLLLNENNPNHLNLEAVIVHELLHLKLYPLDQVTEGLIDAHYTKDTAPYDFVYSQFMTTLEQTVAELTKCYLQAFGKNKTIAYGRVKTMKSFNELYDGLKSYGYDHEE